MKLSNKIAIISLIVTIIGMIISYNLDSTEKVSQKKEVNHSVILNKQVSHGDYSPNINGVNGNVDIKN